LLSDFGRIISASLNHLHVQTYKLGGEHAAPTGSHSEDFVKRD
jgi:hypothetical protein